MKLIRLIAAAAFAAFVMFGTEQTLAQSSAETAKVGLAEYLGVVGQHNLDLAAQRESVQAAQAGVSVAGERPDPLFTGGVASKELAGANKVNAATALTAGVAITLETAGKRGARVRAAESNVALTQSTVATFKRQLNADASAAFVEACRTRAVLARKQGGLASLRDVVRANETRFKAGDIGKLELTQSRLEADRFQTDVVSAGADVAAADVALGTFLGQRYVQAFAARPLQCEWRVADATPAPSGMSDSVDSLDTDALVQTALNARDDVRAAQAAIDNAHDAVELARANRWVDPVLNLGLTNTPRIPAVLDNSGNVSNSPSPRSLSLGVTVSVPIPFSRLQQGELRQAESALTQAQLQLRAVLLKAEGDVRATVVQVQATANNLRSYTDHVLGDAQCVLDGTRTSYRKGASSLLELLNAQRSADDVYLSYLQAEADRANAQVRLQLSTGQAPGL